MIFDLKWLPNAKAWLEMLIQIGADLNARFLELAELREREGANLSANLQRTMRALKPVPSVAAKAKPSRCYQMPAATLVEIGTKVKK